MIFFERKVKLAALLEAWRESKCQSKQGLRHGGMHPEPSSCEGKLSTASHNEQRTPNMKTHRTPRPRGLYAMTAMPKSRHTCSVSSCSGPLLSSENCTCHAELARGGHHASECKLQARNRCWSGRGSTHCRRCAGDWGTLRSLMHLGRCQRHAFALQVPAGRRTAEVETGAVWACRRFAPQVASGHDPGHEAFPFPKEGSSASSPVYALQLLGPIVADAHCLHQALQSLGRACSLSSSLDVD